MAANSVLQPAKPPVPSKHSALSKISIVSLRLGKLGLLPFRRLCDQAAAGPAQARRSIISWDGPKTKVATSQRGGIIRANVPEEAQDGNLYSMASPLRESPLFQRHVVRPVEDQWI